MRKTELVFSSIDELSSLISKKQISAVELVNTYLERIERLQPRLNAYITVCGEEALASAKAIDKSLMKAKPPQKPFLGIPIAIKDQLDTSGVAKLKDAGAILLGKLNVTGGADEPPFGQPRNPWNIDYSPGGSSSGSGIAVSTGLCVSSIGEDTGGSIRVPASYCGVVGFRPSSGLVSRWGLHPLSPSMDTAAPIGRSVADCATMLQVVAGYDPKDALSSHRQVPDYLASLQHGSKGVRMGLIKEFMDDENLDFEIKAAITAAINTLIELGASIDEISIPHIKASMFAVGIIIWCEEATLKRKWYESKYHLFTQRTRVGFLAGSLLPAKAYMLARQAQSLIRSEVLEAFHKYDLLLCPTSPKPVPKIENAKKAASYVTVDAILKRHADGHVGFAPLTGCPAISVPCGFTQLGLPVGFQITGRPFEDATVLGVAHAYEQSTDWHNHHPDL
jgi:aspartyl-tRNA(Asn)/glutamyl-tRNA(Gln) amidotransferase subunit A